MDMSLDKVARTIANKKEAENTVILSNVIELASCVLAKMAGTNMANSIKSSPVTKSVLTSLVSKHIAVMVEKNAIMIAKTK